MKRTAKLILTAITILAVAIPLVALATSETITEPTDGIIIEDTRVLPDGMFFGEDGYCYVLDENGNAQRVYARGTFGRFMTLQFADGEYCWNYDFENQELLRTRNNRSRGCPRWR